MDASDPGVERTTWLMGTEARIRILDLPRDVALAVSERALETIAAVEGLLSTWREETPLARANHSPVGESWTLDPGLNRVLAEALAWSDSTDGAFDPRMGALVDAWDLRGQGRRPDPAAVIAALEASGPGSVQLHAGAWTRAHPRAWVDAGGFGKGFALREALEAIPPEHPAFLDLGGQVVVQGPGSAPGGDWALAVADPRNRREPLLELRIRDVSVATSGLSERGVTVDGERIGHILDPRTGLPVPDRGSVTVVTTDPLVADVLATALYVLGPDEGLRRARTWPGVDVLYALPGPDGVRLRLTPGFGRWLARPLPASLILH